MAPAPKLRRALRQPKVRHARDGGDERAMVPTVREGRRRARARGEGAFYLTLVPIRPRSRGERRSLRTLPGVSLRPGSLAFNPRPRRLSTPSDAFELHPDVRSYGVALRSITTARSRSSSARTTTAAGSRRRRCLSTTTRTSPFRRSTTTCSRSSTTPPAASSTRRKRWDGSCARSPGRETTAPRTCGEGRWGRASTAAG